MGFSSEHKHPHREGRETARQEAQIAARLAAIVDSSEDAIISKSLEGVIETWNRGAEEIFGYTASEAIGQSVLMLIPQERQAEEMEILRRLRNGERISHFETVRLAKNGRCLDVSLTVSPLKDAAGNVIGASTVIRDITPRKQAEAAQLRQTEFDTLITRILARFAAFTGPAIDEQIQRSLEEVSRFIGAEAAFIILISKDMTRWSMAYETHAPGIPPRTDMQQNVPLGQRMWVEQRLLAGEPVQIATMEELPPEAAYEKKYYEREGVQSALLLPLRGLGEQVTGCIGLRTYTTRMAWSQDDIRRLRIFTDALANVLERKRVETELHDSRQMLQQILDTIPQRVFWKDLQSVYLGCNKPFAADAGLADAHAIPGMTDNDLPWRGENAEKFRADDRSVLETGVAKIGFEEAQERFDGSIAWVRTSKMPLRDQQNRIFAVLGTYEDVTDLRHAREALERAKEAAESANRAKDQFIAILSHELRTPLTPVLAIVTALEEMKHLPESARDDLEVIHRNVELEARLIDDLLDVTRIAQGKITLRPEAVDAHSCLRSALGIFESAIDAKHLKISFALEAHGHFVWADPTRLRQVFWNLFSNAIKFSPAHKRIEVRTLLVGPRLRIEIADQGIGIEPDAMLRIFDAFEQGELTRTRRFGGLGLGLSIAKALVEMHQGTLIAVSEGKDKGAVFAVELPLVEPLLKEPTPVDVSGPKVMEPRRILLVEDHEDTLRILARLLRKWGYGVTTANSVRTALERASEQHFDLLVSDLGLPDGSGMDTMQVLRERYHLPAIALSGYGTDEDIRASLDAGFSEHLTKPVSFQTLRTSVQRVMGS
ncbi:MAG: PAS domain S-box protein [Verrucomicrobia bacterium]|nr:PAS domain S-box protein [Verrucomicrobiota bacterium]